MGQFESFIGVDFWTALFILLNTLAIFVVARKYLFTPIRKRQSRMLRNFVLNMRRRSLAFVRKLTVLLRRQLKAQTPCLRIS